MVPGTVHNFTNCTYYSTCTVFVWWAQVGSFWYDFVLQGVQVTSVHAVENLLFFFVSLIFSTAPTQKYYIHTGNILKMTTLYLILCTNGTTNICITIATSCSSVNVVFWTKRWPIWCSKCPFLLPQNKICHDPLMTFKFMKSIIDWGHGMCHTILSYVIWCFDFFSLLVCSNVVPWSMRCFER